MTLYSEILAKCTPEEIAAKNFHVIAAKVNVGRTRTNSLMISERGIMDKYPDGASAADAVLTKLETFANSGAPGSGPVKRAMKFLAQPDGIDIGAASTQAQLTALGAAGVLTVDEANKLKGLAATTDDFVTWDQCQQAFIDNGAI